MLPSFFFSGMKYLFHVFLFVYFYGLFLWTCQNNHHSFIQGINQVVKVMPEWIILFVQSENKCNEQKGDGEEVEALSSPLI